MPTDLPAMTRGDTAKIDITGIKDATGALMNLTGKTVVFTARRSITDVAAYVTHDNGGVGGVTVTNVAADVRVTLSPGDTSALPDYPTVLVWDLEVRDGADRYTPASGTLPVTPDVTRGA